MGYYKQIKQAKIQLDNILKRSKETSTNLDVDLIIYELGLNFECSDKPLIKALDIASKKYDFVIKNREIIWNAQQELKT